MLNQKLALVAVLTAVCLPGRPTAVWAAGEQSAGSAPRMQAKISSECPSLTGLDAALGSASTLMGQMRYQDAAALLQPLAPKDCDPRVSLLLAAALEAGGDAAKATDQLQRAHSVWPSNNSISASLARAYFASGQTDQAIKALTHFHATAETPQQEMEMAVMVYLAAHQLVPAQTVAAAAYKAHPSVHSLLLLANTLQLQGRYPDVNRLLGNKRAAYSNSPEFLMTLAESEFDAGIYPAAREDLERAIALGAKSYQAHYLLGNVLAKQGNADRAIAEYRLAIDLAPDQPRTYFQLALVLRSKEDDAGEQRALEQALAADSRYAPAQCELGRILLEEHSFADAVSHLSVAIQYNPRAEEAYFLLAKAYAGLGDKEKSNEMVKRLVAVRKENRPGQESRKDSQPAASQVAVP